MIPIQKLKIGEIEMLWRQRFTEDEYENFLESYEEDEITSEELEIGNFASVCLDELNFHADQLRM